MRVSFANPDLHWATKVLGCATLMSALIAPATCLHAQSPAPAAGHSATHPSAQHVSAKRKHARRAEKSKPEAKTVAAPAVPPPPPRPNWPVNDPAAAAKVTWDSQGLQIQAQNSSLSEILAQVAADTGVKVQGISHDQRVFGVYGPAPAREVLSELLHGTNYNFLMLGDLGNGTPKEVILSGRSAGGSQSKPPSQPSQSYDPGGDQEQQPAPVYLNRPPMAPVSPQERMREMQRQQEMLQQQQEQQNQQQQGQPPEQQEPPVNPPPQ